MRDRYSEGFILPFTLLIASAVMLLAVLAAERIHFHMVAREHALLRTRTENMLRQNVLPLAERLGELILDGESTSALIPNDPAHPSPLKPLRINRNGKQVPLHSIRPENPGDAVCFNSPLSSECLAASRVTLSPQNHHEQFTLAWAAEDIGLMAPGAVPWPAWPLPSWMQAPRRNRPGVNELLDPAILAGWTEEPRPVVTSLGLRFGIFASGTIGSREKIVRVRYYLEGALWNPYNIPLRMHDSGGMEASFRLIFWNLPEVRIHNLSRGLSTGWIGLDRAANSQSGNNGIDGWIRTAPQLEAGAQVAFLDPDPDRQPEGLARTLHGGFAAGPADRIRIEFRMGGEGVSAACLPMETANPLEAARSGHGWFRIEGFPVQLDPVEWTRADDDPAPFYLYSGSLGFRQENARHQIAFQRTSACFEGQVDPRRQAIVNGDSRTDANGFAVTDQSLVEIKSLDLQGDLPDKPVAGFHPPLFSRPEKPPGSLLAASDIQQWREGFRLGSANAKRINSVLDLEGTFVDEPPLYEPSFPVNMLSPQGWRAILETSDHLPSDPESIQVAAYPNSQADRAIDFRQWSMAAVDGASRGLSEMIRHKPSGSISDFFNRGLLTDSFPASIAGDPGHQLLPLRGWLRKAPAVRRHGSAWILHLLLEGKRNRNLIRRSARVWLLERAAGMETSRFEIIRFEWTDPADHCRQPRA
jgi:hypothetical protein